MAPIEPVGIVGMGIRLPGVDGVSALVEASAGRHLPVARVGEVPLTWVANESEAAAIRSAVLFDDPGAFDPEFFGMTPREAVHVDPAQRLVLTVAWEALEDAGYRPSRWRGANVGVYVGTGGSDYGRGALSSPSEVGVYTNPGFQSAVSSQRVSYCFDFRGPCMTLDTTCSSSAVAVHLACRDLRERDVDLAIVAGVNVILSAAVSLGFARLGLLSKSGTCLPFSNAADGYVRGEGAVALVLRRAADAHSDGDRIHAEILGSSVNNKGRSNGLLAPRHARARDVMADALRRSGVSGETVSIVEASGTATPMGDRMEAEAIAAALGPRDQPVILQCAKASFGHLEPASGILSIARAAAGLHRGKVFPQPGASDPVEGFDWKGRRIELPTQTRTLDVSDRPCALVASFGYSGTYAALVLRGRELAGSSRGGTVSAAPTPPLLMSARSIGDLPRVAASYRRALESNAISVEDLVHSTASRRERHGCRISLEATSRSALVQGLRAVEERGRSVARPAVAVEIVLVPGDRPLPPLPLLALGGPWTHPAPEVDLVRAVVSRGLRLSRVVLVETEYVEDVATALARWDPGLPVARERETDSGGAADGVRASLRILRDGSVSDHAVLVDRDDAIAADARWASLVGIIFEAGIDVDDGSVFDPLWRPAIPYPRNEARHWLDHVADDYLSARRTGGDERALVGESPRRDRSQPPANWSVLQELVACFAKISGVPDQEIDPGVDLMATGLDSIMAMDFRAQVERRFGHSVSMTDFLEGMTLRGLAETIGLRGERT